MGAWGTGTFENDGASDYGLAIIEGRDASGLERTLDRVLEMGTGYLEAPDGSEALAAADIRARLMGRPGESTPYTQEIDAWVGVTKITPSSQLIDKARRAVSRVLTEPSELMELWQDSDDFEAWKASVEVLARRLI